MKRRPVFALATIAAAFAGSFASAEDMRLPPPKLLTGPELAARHAQLRVEALRRFPQCRQVGSVVLESDVGRHSYSCFNGLPGTAVVDRRSRQITYRELEAQGYRHVRTNDYGYGFFRSFTYVRTCSDPEYTCEGANVRTYGRCYASPFQKKYASQCAR